MPLNFCVNRRQLVTAGSVTLALAVARPMLSWSASGRSPYRAIYDERFDAGRHFALVAASHGWITRAIRGDVTQLWYHELAVRWKRGPAPITGLTTSQSLFVLERLAWDVGMRVTERDTNPGTQLVRWLISLPNRGGIGL